MTQLSLFLSLFLRVELKIPTLANTHWVMNISAPEQPTVQQRLMNNHNNETTGSQSVVVDGDRHHRGHPTQFSCSRPEAPPT